MEFTKKESYAIQMKAYLNSGDYAKAKALAEQMLKKFPKEPLSHLMAAKAYFLSGDYPKANLEGRKAYNLSHSKSDMRVSAIMTASALFMLKRYDEGYSLLEPFKADKNEEMKKLLVIFYMVKGKGEDAGRYYKELHDLNRAAAEKLIKSLAEGRSL